MDFKGIKCKGEDRRDDPEDLKINGTGYLVELIKMEKWAEIILRCKTHPQDCQYFDDCGLTALHHLLMPNSISAAPLEIFQCVSNANPAAIHTLAQDIYGYTSTALMWAMIAPLKKFRSVLERSKTITPKNIQEYTGLPEDVIIRYIMPYCARPLLFCDRDGDSILHRLASPLMIITDRYMKMKLVLEAESTLSTIVNNYKRTAFHLLAAHELASELSSKFLASTYVALQYDEVSVEGDWQRTRLFQLLLHACPHAAAMKDSQGNTPLHLMCKINRGILESISAIAGACIDAFMVKNNAGEIPLLTALLAGAHIDIIQMLITLCPDAAYEEGKSVIQLLNRPHNGLIYSVKEKEDIQRWLDKA